MLDQLLEIIHCDSLIKSVHENDQLFHADVGFMSYTLTILYNLIFEKKIFQKLKEEKPFEALEKLHNVENITIQFTSLTISAILKQEKIDEIDSPSKIARSYLYMIENTINEITHAYHGIELEGVLTNLESMSSEVVQSVGEELSRSRFFFLICLAVVQNEDVKEDIVIDDGIDLLGDCAFRMDLDYETIRLPALRIIDTISFAKTAPERISQNDLLMDHLDGLSRKQDSIEASIAKRLLWKAEKEEEYLARQERITKEMIGKRTFKIFDEKKAPYQYINGDYRVRLDNQINHEQFDILLSSCPYDRDFCHTIRDRLKESKLYRISLDTNNLHSTNPEAMANAVDSSTIIILCVSNEYRGSNACRLQAEYAKKKNSHLIGVKVDARYTPSRWLDEGVLEKNALIDFSRSDFNSACLELIAQIDVMYAEMIFKTNQV